MRSGVLLKLFFFLIFLESPAQAILKSSDTDTVYSGKEMQYKVSQWKKGCGIVWRVENGKITGPTRDSTVVVVWDNVKDTAKIEVRQTGCPYKSISLSEPIVVDKPQGKKQYRLKGINMPEKSTHSTSQKHRRWFVNSLEIFGGPNVSYNYGNWRLRNYSDLRGVSNIRYLKWGWAAGAGFSIPIYKKLEMNVRVEYEKTGSDNNLTVPADYEDGVYRHSYVRSDYSYYHIKNTLLLQYPVISNTHFDCLAGVGGYLSLITHTYLKRYYGTYNFYVYGSNEFLYEASNERVFETLNKNGTSHSIAFQSTLKAFSTLDIGMLASLQIRYKINARHSMGFQLLQTIGMRDVNYPMRFNPSFQEEIYRIPPEYRLYTSLNFSYMFHLNN